MLGSDDMNVCIEEFMIELGVAPLVNTGLYLHQRYKLKLQISMKLKLASSTLQPNLRFNVVVQPTRKSNSLQLARNSESNLST